jgi:hypothetical protein
VLEAEAEQVILILVVVEQAGEEMLVHPELLEQ